MALLGDTLAQFSRAQPSAGGFITFVGKSFGPTSAVTTALLSGLGYIIAMSSVVAISGGFLAITLQHYLGWNVPWIIWTLLLTAIAVAMMVRGMAVSTRLARLFFGVEMLVLVVVSVAAIITHHAHLCLAPFQPSRITGGVTGLAEGFPISIYLFIGWENSSALAEETDDPRRNVGHARTLRLCRRPDLHLRALIAGTNSQARLVFNAGREGLLPSFIGRVDPVRRTPTNAIPTFILISLLIIGGWGAGHILGGHTESVDLIEFFVEASTMGTILVLLVYLACNIALSFSDRKCRPAEFSPTKQLPGLGVVVIVVPLFPLTGIPRFTAAVRPGCRSPSRTAVRCEAGG